MGFIFLVGLLFAYFLFSDGNPFLILLLYVFLLISTCIVIYLYQFYFNQSKKSFLSIYYKILKCDRNKHKKSAIIGSLQDYLKQSDEEILLQNLYFAGKNIVYWYNFIFATLTSLILLIWIVVNVQELYKFQQEIAILIFLPFYLPTIIMYLLVFMYLKYKKSSLIQINFNLFIKVFLGLQFNLIVIYLSLFVFIILLEWFVWVVSLIYNIDNKSIINIFTSWVSFLKFSNLYNLNDLKGNQFSLSSLYFTLAFTGTAVFSIANIYTTQKKYIRKKQSEMTDTYKNWFKDNVDSINLNAFNYHREDVINEFNSKISYLRTILYFEKGDELRAFTKNYELSFFLIVISYLAGICTLIIPSKYIPFAFFLFINLPVLLSVSLYYLFVNVKSAREDDYESQQATIQVLKAQIQDLNGQLLSKEEQIEKLKKDMDSLGLMQLNKKTAS